MQLNIGAITRVNISRGWVGGWGARMGPCSSEKAITLGRVLVCEAECEQSKIVFADCSNLGLYWWSGSEVVVHIPYLHHSAYSVLIFPEGTSDSLQL